MRIDNTLTANKFNIVLADTIIVDKYNTMENSILEAINYVSKISRQKVTVESISAFLNKKGPSNIEDQYIMEALKDAG